jgi:hypothetical protein
VRCASWRHISPFVFPLPLTIKESFLQLGSIEGGRRLCLCISERTKRKGEEKKKNKKGRKEKKDDGSRVSGDGAI